MTDPIGDPLTFDIIGSAMAVHRDLGPGFLEAVYQGALAIEFRHRGVPHEREVRLPVTYRDEPTGAPYRADFVCGERVIVELKAQREVGPADTAQVVHYLKATGFKLGLLLNFGGPRLVHRRVIHADDWKRNLSPLAEASEEI